MMISTARELLERSRRLGSDPRVTNYGGGNTSAKGEGTDPSSGEQVPLLWVKGSGSDLGTLTEDNLCAIRLDRFRALESVYRGVEFEDEMVDRFDYVLHGKGGAAPSIDTSMHALVDAGHVDHLHPDAGIAIATSIDGPELTRRVYGDAVVWVDWRRPGFQLGLDMRRVRREHPEAVGAILGGHGITAWGATSAECERNSLWIIETAESYIAEHGAEEPFGPVVVERVPLPDSERRRRAAALMPSIRKLASTDQRVIGHFTDSPAVLDFLSRTEFLRLSALGTSCPDHFLRTKVAPLALDLPSAASVDDVLTRLAQLHAEYRREYGAYYSRHATADSPAIRGADPSIVLVPGVGMFSFGADKLTARVAGEYFVNAINAMRGAEALSSYRPIPESEKFRIEYWELEEAKLRRRPAPQALATRVGLVTGADSPYGRAIAERLTAEGACVVLSGRTEGELRGVSDTIGGSDASSTVVTGRHPARDAEQSVDAALIDFGGLDLIVLHRSPGSSPDETQAVLRRAVAVLEEQGTGGTIVIVQEDAELETPDAQRLGRAGIRLGIVDVSAADGRPAPSAENVARAVYALCGPDLAHSTALQVSFDID